MSDTKHQDGAASGLFPELPAVEDSALQAVAQARARELSEQPARLRQPNRKQIELRTSDLESLLGEDHRARLVWGYVERQDLSRLTAAIKARGSQAGGAAIDPRIQAALEQFPRYRPPSGATVTRPKTPGPAPPTPMRGS